MEWISTKDRLPECTQNVMDYGFGIKINDNWLESETVLLAVKETRNDNTVESYVILGRIDDKNEWWVGEDAIDSLRKNQEVTHWMNMPKSPTY